MTTTQLQQLATKYNIGIQTLQDIIKELQIIPHDPREDLAPPSFSSNALDIKDIEIGMKLQGTVRNITDFGAFVDIGLHNDGLVHKSQMADHFVSHPIDVVSLGQEVSVRVIDIDHEREKISLSMKSESQGNQVLRQTPRNSEHHTTTWHDEIVQDNPFAGNMLFISKKK